MTAKPPTMNRSRGQLATVYAPHSVFTFEGGTGACMARSVPNPAYEPASASTRELIHEQIMEFVEAWVGRATSGEETVVPVVAERALTARALRDGAVHLPIGILHFQVPERVAYVPFPLAFTCSRCGLYRSCESEAGLARLAGRFRDACPEGRADCADDWQQLDVVMAHWSGAVEPLSPLRRFVRDTDLQVGKSDLCARCEGNRYYLRRQGATFARWYFECVDCAEVREIRVADFDTMEWLAEPFARGLNVLPQINMEPVSYRASSVFYPQGDRLLVFGKAEWVRILCGGLKRHDSRLLRA